MTPDQQMMYLEGEPREGYRSFATMAEAQAYLDQRAKHG